LEGIKVGLSRLAACSDAEFYSAVCLKKLSDRNSMKDELFKELVTSVREGGAILRGEVAPSRKFVVTKADVKRIRVNYRLSQGQFAALLGISVATLQNWEQGRRMPKGAARVLLQVAAKHPETVWDVVKPARPSQNEKKGSK
jgi:putative transcriptional regulator